MYLKNFSLIAFYCGELSNYLDMLDDQSICQVIYDS
tara:strand:- start:375 stop:482 length:108 start_codon:yes stop_codon:yes gene_type:complete